MRLWHVRNLRSFPAFLFRQTDFSDAHVQRKMELWVENAVIKHNFCPFAASIVKNGHLRYAICRSTTGGQACQFLEEELHMLKSNVHGSTLVIYPSMLQKFSVFLRFLPQAHAVLESLDLVGVIQIATFHPQYVFAPTHDNTGSNSNKNCHQQQQSIDHYTNRAPFPTLHLIREDHMTRAVAAHPNTARIPERNVRRLRAMSGAERQELLRLSSPDS